MNIKKSGQGKAVNGKGRYREQWVHRQEASKRDARLKAIEQECVRDERGVLVCAPRYTVGYGINTGKEGI